MNDSDPGRQHRPSRQPRQHNGLTASAFVPLTDVDPQVGDRLLHALGRARIAAYLSMLPTGDDVRRLYVASDDRVDARTVVAAAMRGLDATDPSTPAADLTGRDDADDDPNDPDATRRTFDALVADWNVDTVAAVREAERDLTREDADWRLRLNRSQAGDTGDEVWLDEDHYVPPSPPPLPRLAAPTIIAMTILAISVVLLGIGGQVGLANTFTLLLGVCGMVLGFAILFSRLREHRRDDGDDGASV